MAIVKMNKFELYSFVHNRDMLLEKLQNFNYVHIKDSESFDDEYIELPKVDNSENIVEVGEKLTKTKWAIDLLEKYGPKKSSLEAAREEIKTYSLSQISDMAEKFDFENNYKKLSNLDSQLTRLEQANQNLEQRRDELLPWKQLNISSGEIENFDRVTVTTGTVPNSYLEKLKEDTKDTDNLYIEEISSDSSLTYLLVISSNYQSDREILNNNGFVEVKLKSEDKVSVEIENIEAKIKANKQEHESVEAQIKDEYDKIEGFKIYYDYLSNIQNKNYAKDNFKTTDRLDIIQGYIPREKENDFTNMLKTNLGDGSYYLEVTEADKDDPNVPIILKNKKLFRPYETITEMYSLPKYNEIDPTPLLAPFYTFFAGMMIGDLGYGLLVAIAITVALHAFKLSKGTEKFLRLFRNISIASMFWGFIYGSFFGGIIPMTPIIDMSRDTMLLIGLCLVFGFIHLFFALGIKAYMKIRDGKPLDAFFDVGLWYIIIVSLLLLILNNSLGLSKTVFNIAKWAAILSAIGIILTGGRDAESVGGRIGLGVYELYGISGWIGDFASYMRLMALGLSGAYIGTSINIIVQMMTSSGIIGFIGGLLVFVLGQAFNAFLSYLSAYVHSSRLIFVEMFNKFYEGGGKPFKKLITDSKFFNITND
ncbi:MAG: V-type ATP synthase subunit I [Finegoldia sp.]|nr:V-type ATP synthase subunit I [Finegoldia sp.]